MPFKRGNTNNLMTFECFFLISQYHENCNAMSSFSVLRHYLGTLLSVVQHNVLTSLFWFLFSDIACNKYSQPVQIPVERSTFKCNIQKSVLRSLHCNLKKYYVTLKNRNMQFRFEVSMTDASRYQLMTKDKVPVFKGQLKIFTRVVFNLAFRVSGRSVP